MAKDKDTNIFARIDEVKRVARSIGYEVDNRTANDVVAHFEEIGGKVKFCEDNFDAIGMFSYTMNFAFILIANSPVEWIKGNPENLKGEALADAVDKAEAFLALMVVYKTEEATVKRMRERVCHVFEVEKMIANAVKEADDQFFSNLSDDDMVDIDKEGKYAVDRMKEIWIEKIAESVDNKLNSSFKYIVENKDNLVAYRIFLLILGMMIYAQCRFGLMLPLRKMTAEIGFGAEKIFNVSGSSRDESINPEQYLSQESVERLSKILDKLEEDKQQ